MTLCLFFSGSWGEGVGGPYMDMKMTEIIFVLSLKKFPPRSKVILNLPINCCGRGQTGSSADFDTPPQF